MNRIKRLPYTATVGAVNQRWGSRPLGECDCGQKVVSLDTTTDDGRKVWFLANAYPYKNGRGYFYIGAKVHNSDHSRKVN